MRRYGSTPLMFEPHRLRNERGIALPMVLLVFIVGVALISALLVAIVGSSKVTVTNKNILQAQASAEAGIAAAEVAMQTNPCNTDLAALETNTDALTYSFTTSKPTCVDISTSERHVVVRSTGTSGDATATVEATFMWASGNTPPQNGGNYLAYVAGSTLNLHNSQTLTLTDPQNKKPVFDVRTANFDCGKLVGGSVPGTLRVGGVFDMSGDCSIAGDLHLGGSANFSKKLDVAGNLRVSQNVTVTINGTIGGSVFSNGSVQVQAGKLVKGDLNVNSTGTTTIAGTVEGNVFANGEVNVAEGGKVNGSIIGATKVVVNNKARVVGNVTAGTELQVNTGGVIEGSVIAGGKVTISGAIGVMKPGPVHTGGSIETRGEVQIASGIEIPGTIRAAGKITLSDNNMIGRTLPGCVVSAPAGVTIEWNSPPPPPAPYTQAQRQCVSASGVPSAPQITPVPSVEPPPFESWRDFQYDSATIVALKNQGLQTIATSGVWACDEWSGQNANKATAWGNLESLTTAAQFDLSQCAIDVSYGQNKPVRLKYDVMIVTDKASSFKQLTFEKHPDAPGSPRIWIVDPGGSLNGMPQCTTGSTVISLEQVVAKAPVSLMVYSPCTVFLKKAEIFGSVYAGGMDTQASGSELAFNPIGLPTWSTAGGTTGGGTGAGNGVLGNLLVQRNVD